MAVASSDRKKLLQGLVHSLQQCVEAEAWGLRVEAAEEGQKCVHKLRQVASPGNCCFAAEEKELFLRMSYSIQQRVSSLQDVLQETASEGDDCMKRFKSALASLWDGSASVGDVTSSLTNTLPQLQSSDKKIVEQSKPVSAMDYSVEEEEEEEEEKTGTLLHRGAMKSGHTYLTITIDKIGLKDPNGFTDPFITVTVKNYFGINLETPQDTPVATQWEVCYILFSIPVEIQRAIEDIPRGAAIFFEFKHFSPKRGGITTHCYSFMEMDEIRPGKAFLEIYKRPPDYTRKRVCLLSIKPLYLHLTLSLHKT